MSVTKSILESFELSTGTEVTIQASRSDRVVLSIDSSESNHSYYMTTLEAIKLASLLNVVINEQQGVE